MQNWGNIKLGKMTMEDFYRRSYGLKDEDFIAKLCEISRFVSFKKGETILSIGERARWLYLMVDGGVRCFYHDDKGREITDCFIFLKGDAVVPLMYEKPASCEFITYKKTKLVAMPMAEGMALIQNSSEGAACFVELLRAANMRDFEMKNQMYGTAARRYEWFCSKYSQLVGEVSDKCIATYIGVAPESLSRLRRDPEIMKMEKALGIVSSSSGANSGSIQEKA